jgi:integrase
MGAVRKTATGRWQAVVTLPDGSQRRLPRGGFPAGTSEAKAREYARHLAEKAEALPMDPPARDPAEKTDRSEGRAADAWIEAWFADREARGLTSVRENRGHWATHIETILGGKHARDWTRDDIRTLSLALDSKVRAGTISAKTARNVWGTATRMCDDALSHKSDALRCRNDNPAQDVRGPDRGANKSREFLYPSEFLRFVDCEDVPMQWRRAVAVATYTFLRLGELMKLRWDDVDLERKTIHVHRANDRRDGGVKATKGRQARRIPIHPELLPLLKNMRAGAAGSDLVLELPSLRDMARGFRRWLEVAGIERRSLLESEATSRRIVFHDLRGTGITWHAVAGTEPLRIQQWAGHTDFQTTQGYLATADAVGRDGFGEPFPTLPRGVFSGTIFLRDRESSQKWRSGRDSNPRPPA